MNAIDGVNVVEDVERWGTHVNDTGEKSGPSKWVGFRWYIVRQHDINGLPTVLLDLLNRLWIHLVGSPGAAVFNAPDTSYSQPDGVHFVTASRTRLRLA